MSLPGESIAPAGPVPGGVSLGETGLTVTTELDFDDWQRLGATLHRIEQSVQWWVGDWLNYGAAAYGEKYAQAVDVTGTAFSTLQNYAWVSKQIEPSRRRPALSWSHHREVAGLDPTGQDRWLAAAETEGWSKGQLERELRLTPDGDDPDTPDGPTPDSAEQEPATVGRVEWSIRISVPMSADLIAVLESVERSAKALDAILGELRCDPEVTITKVHTVTEEAA